METSTETNNDNEIKIIKSWDEYNLKHELLRGIYAYGFENPSEIQQKAILPIINSRDILAQAQSGSGKTGTFSISSLQRIDISIKAPQVVIMAPTHELVKQISNVVTNMGIFMEGLVVRTMIGGTSIQQDASELRSNPPHIIVGCSGRIYDMIVRKYVKTNEIRMLVLDEADEMLSKGFKDQIYNIFQYLNQNIQIALFSATMPDEIIHLSKKIMRNPVCITMKKEDLSLECIKQYFIALQDDISKFSTLKDLFSMISVNQCIIYCNSVKRVMDLESAMNNEGFSVCSIHSSITKEERDNVFAKFRMGAFRVMISSNITARGIDVQQVSTVINFDIPKCVHTYLHRIGRSGRWGRKGLAINFITKRDIFMIKRIESHYSISIDEMPNNLN